MGIPRGSRWDYWFSKDDIDINVIKNLNYFDEAVLTWGSSLSVGNHLILETHNNFLKPCEEKQ